MAYVYTKPRVPIAAMYASPGPCYKLPNLCYYKGHDPRSNHPPAPAWYFGRKEFPPIKSFGPGPIYWPDPHYFLNGKDGQPLWSLCGKLKDYMGFNTPGPGTYKDCPLHVYNRRLPGPLWSFGQRHKHISADQNPAPCTYIPDSMIGPQVQGGKRNSPLWTFHQRTAFGDMYEDIIMHRFQGPSPTTYNTVKFCCYCDCPPEWSLFGRINLPFMGSCAPSPGGPKEAFHHNETQWIHKPKAPEWGFGIHHSPYLTPCITMADIDC